MTKQECYANGTLASKITLRRVLIDRLRVVKMKQLWKIAVCTI